MSPLGRRMFIAGGVAAAIAVPYAGYKLVWGKPDEIVVAILERRVGYLNVDPTAFETFAARYVAFRADAQSQMQKLSVVAVPFQYMSPYEMAPVGHALRRLEDNVVSLFLMSTDFFENGADESREVKYVAFYDPAVTPCRNFLARPVQG